MRRYKFIDAIRLRVKGGKGGDGGISYKHLGRKKKPTGGHGGPGGDVVIRASQHVQNLNVGKFVFNAGDGERGGPNGWLGKNGKTLEILVPIGTVVNKISYVEPEYLFDDRMEKEDLSKNMSKLNVNDDDADDEDDGDSSSDDDDTSSSQSSEEDEEEDDDDDEDEDWNDEDDDIDIKPKRVEEFLADLNEHGKGLVVAKGGRGGRGNGDFASMSFQFYDHSPALKRRKGKFGTQAEISLALKSIADIGLVGFPNAGKSTLLGSISRAKPHVASFPFTTLHPYIGCVEFTDGEKVTVADIPGLIEGAHANRGLGHRFLRHVERTSVLVYVIDCGNLVTGDDKTDPYETILRNYQLLVKELEMYLSGLSLKPALLVLNKMDSLQATNVSNEKLVKQIALWNFANRNVPDTFPLPMPSAIHFVSAKYGGGLGKLVADMRITTTSCKSKDNH